MSMLGDQKFKGHRDYPAYILILQYYFKYYNS